MSIMDYFRHPPDLRNLSPREVDELSKKEGFRVIDVRTRFEFNNGHIHNSVLYSLGHEKDIMNKFGNEGKIILVCKTGHRSRAAANRLNRLGLSGLNHLEGGVDRWRKENLPLIKED
ncbi:MAG: rhodanese-like domain-containing protein [Thermoplasmataceae archaeon]|jgi:rhodanese-related sulfurtransferase